MGVLCACGARPPEPPAALRDAKATPAALIQALRAHPLALFHPLAEPGARRLGSELHRLVEAAGSSLASNQDAMDAGSLVGSVERALRCADVGGLKRADVDRTAALLIESADAFGTSSELPKGANALAWAQAQARVTGLGAPLYDKARSIPPPARDGVLAARSTESLPPCP